jgi:site-specific recombinase XerD
MAPAEMHQRTRPQVEPRLLDRVRETIRRKHYSLRTEVAYIDWIKRYIFFHRKRHPAEMGAPEMEQFLNHLAVDRRVASSTQNQALSALVFLYREVLRQDFEWMENLDRAKRPSRLPVVLTESEVHNLLAHLDGQNWLMASLLYGAGLRLMECIRLRVKDIDFEYRQLTVRDGKGAHDRVTMLPEASSEVLRTHLARVDLYTSRIWQVAAAMFIYRTRLHESTRMPASIGIGNTFSRRRGSQLILAPGSTDDIILTRSRCSAR